MFVVFDLTNRESFETVDSFVAEARDTLGKSIPIAVIGTKSDEVESRQVPEDDAKRKAEELGVPYHEVSSKTGEGVPKAVEGLLRAALSDADRAHEQEELARVEADLAAQKIEDARESASEQPSGCVVS